MARKGRTGDSNKSPGLPTKDEILEFIQSASGTVGKREIARAFNIKGAQRIDLKQLLRQMADDGLLSGSRKRLRQPGALPSVTVIEIFEIDEHGEHIGRPVSWDGEQHGSPPRVLLVARQGRRGSGPPPGVGDRALVRLSPSDQSEDDSIAYRAQLIKRLPRERQRLLGIYRAVPGRGGVIDPIDRRQLKEWPVPKGDEGEATDGELVRFEIAKPGRFGSTKAKVIDCLGNPDGQKSTSLIAIESFNLPNEFPPTVIEEIATLKTPTISGREDLRDIPLITIDPADAKDHDDAVWAGPDDDPKNSGGFVVLVAIADVAEYVRPSSAIDKEGLKRGNSVYFPDRVVPMLPERISNDLCSLREGEDRPCLAVRMTFDKSGRKRKHLFVRGLMRSAARLSYEEAQAAIDNQPNDQTGPLLETILKPLWQAYTALRQARNDREPLDLDLPERKIILDDEGRVSAIHTPERLDAHRLIEAFMIQANVAAAEALENKNAPVIYRVHDAPGEEKLTALRDFLATLHIKIAKSGPLKPQQFNSVLRQVRGGEFDQLVNEVILRTQAHAEYSASNCGHFGLNLRRYAHFTSPIRRYADLFVHRSLIRALGLGAGGLSDNEIARIDETATTISETERRAQAAERDTVDRLIASYLADQIGARFQARIAGVTRSGLFVRLAETSADGFIPISTVGNDYFVFDETHLKLIGERSGETYRLGDQVEVRLVEAIPSAGALRFELLSEGKQEKPIKPRRAKSRKPMHRKRRRSH
ncbi:ribonuclease R [bacterium MnTg02]|nr:ribonuclease R [bacterium MnTg02]